MPTKLSNFQRRDLRVVEPDRISQADAAGLKPPALTPEERAGIAVEARIASDRLEAFAVSHERYMKEKAAFEQSRDDAIWQRVLARRLAI